MTRRNGPIWGYVVTLCMLAACRGGDENLTRGAGISVVAPSDPGPDASALSDGIHKIAWQGDTLWFNVLHGRKQGYSKSYHANGSVHRQGAFKDDLPDGWWEELDPEGRLLSAGGYRAGLREGDWRFYGSLPLGERVFFPTIISNTLVPSGTLAAEGKYEHGRPTGPWRFYDPDGNLLAEGRLDHGTMDGWWRLFDGRGVLQREGHFAKDQPDGHQIFYEQGIVREEGNMSKGRRTGTWKRYNAQGELEALDEW